MTIQHATAEGDSLGTGQPPVGEPASLEQRFQVVSPLGPKPPDRASLAPRLGDLDGKIVAEVWDWMFYGDSAFPVLRDELQSRYPGVKVIDYTNFGNIHGPDEVAVIKGLPEALRRANVDAVVVGIGNCATCTPAVIRAAAEIEKAGIPTTSVVGRVWAKQAEMNAAFLGLPALPMAVFHAALTNDEEPWDDDELRGVITDRIVEGLTADVGAEALDHRRPADEDPKAVVFVGTFDEVNDHFHRRRWSDGLPVVPPTRDRVEAMLAAVERDPDEVIAIVPVERRQLTVWSVAVSGVIAGCRPEYMPVLLAAAEAIADPEYRLEDFGTAPSWEPLAIVSGPVIEELDFNYGPGAMRPGRRANTAIGRAVRLLVTNVAGFRTETETDKATFGNPMNVVLAEDEATVRELGWATYGEDQGLAPGASGVTMMGVLGMSAPTFGTLRGQEASVESDLQPLVDVFGRGMCGWWTFTGALFGRWHPLVVINPSVARRLHAAGWGKDDLRRYLYEQCRTPASKIEREGEFVGVDIRRNVEAGILPDTYLESDDPDRLVPVFVRPEWIGVVVAGGPDVDLQRGLMNNHQQGAPVTKTVRGRVLR